MHSYPPPDHYAEALQNGRTAFNRPYLQSASFKEDLLGLPYSSSGQFALTYKAKTQGQQLAVRVFREAPEDIKSRYVAISKALARDTSGFFVNFEYVEGGLTVRGKKYPFIQMDWIEGDTIITHVEKTLRNSLALNELKSEVSRLATHLEDTTMSHGDLQHGNILIQNGRIRLVDYDGMFVPGMTSNTSFELGHRNYQHPKRGYNHVGPSLDRFSLIVFDLCLEALSLEPDLFRRYNIGENLLFTDDDYKKPNSSPLIGELRRLQPLKKSVEAFVLLCQGGFDAIPSLHEFKYWSRPAKPKSEESTAKAFRPESAKQSPQQSALQRPIKGQTSSLRVYALIALGLFVLASVSYCSQVVSPPVETAKNPSVIQPSPPRPQSDSNTVYRQGGVAETLPTPRPSDQESFSKPLIQVIREVQTALASFECAPGPIDGKAGNMTWSAIDRFLASNGGSVSRSDQGLNEFASRILSGSFKKCEGVASTGSPLIGRWKGQGRCSKLLNKNGSMTMWITGRSGNKFTGRWSDNLGWMGPLTLTVNGSTYAVVAVTTEGTNPEGKVGPAVGGMADRGNGQILNNGSVLQGRWGKCTYTFRKG